MKRWCDLGVIPTIRTVGGHRRITLSGLREFLRSTNRTLADPKVLGIEDLELELVKQGPARRPVISGEGREPVQKEFRSALAAGDETRCMEILRERISQGWPRAEVAEHLIAEAMRALGDAWNCGQLEVYQERRSCTICTRMIDSLRQGIESPPSDAPVAIGAAPESDPYQLPSSMVEMTLRELGWNAINLGNDLPLASLVQAVKDYQPSLVWLSVSSVADPDRFVREQNKLADSLGSDVSMIVGGRGLDDELRPRLRYTAHCDSLRHLTELAAMLNR